MGKRLGWRVGGGLGSSGRGHGEVRGDQKEPRTGGVNPLGSSGGLGVTRQARGSLTGTAPSRQRVCVPQDCPPGRGTGQAPTQSCRCRQAKRAVGSEVVSARGIWEGANSACHGQEEVRFSFSAREEGDGGWGAGAVTHSGTGDYAAAASPRVPTSPDPCQPPLPEQGPRKGLGTGRLCGWSLTGDAAMPCLGALRGGSRPDALPGDG